MDIRFDNKNVVVTGASTGIGKATVIEFARSGASVIVNYFRSAEAAKQVVKEIEKEGGKAFSVKANVSRTDGVARLLKETTDIFGDRVDILVNNAGGLLERTPLMDVSEELWDKCIDLNVKSVFLCSKAFVPIMKKNGYGRIINVSSMAARNGGGVGATHYSSSKAAVLTFSKGLAKELANTGITVNNIAPGIITTPFHDKFTPIETRENFKKMIPLGREGTAQEVAYSILFLASEYADYIIGETLEINGGLLMD